LLIDTLRSRLRVLEVTPVQPGREGWVRSRAWICDFSSQLKTIALAGGQAPASGKFHAESPA
jgi:hypothetical protein